jgi:hypothetical protein
VLNQLSLFPSTAARARRRDPHVQFIRLALEAGAVAPAWCSRKVMSPPRYGSTAPSTQATGALALHLALAPFQQFETIQPAWRGWRCRFRRW